MPQNAPPPYTTNMIRVNWNNCLVENKRQKKNSGKKKLLKKTEKYFTLPRCIKFHRYFHALLEMQEIHFYIKTFPMIFYLSKQHQTSSCSVNKKHVPSFNTIIELYIMLNLLNSFCFGKPQKNSGPATKRGRAWPLRKTTLF